MECVQSLAMSVLVPKTPYSAHLNMSTRRKTVFFNVASTCLGTSSRPPYQVTSFRSKTATSRPRLLVRHQRHAELYAFAGPTYSSRLFAVRRSHYFLAIQISGRSRRITTVALIFERFQLGYHLRKNFLPIRNIRWQIRERYQGQRVHT